MPEVVASAPPAADEAPDATESLPKVQRTEFGVDVGGANSVGGLRALWRGLLKTRANAPLAALRPIIVIKESSTGLGMQLRLVAGPLTDAAAAAKICAAMIANERPCETTVFDGQRLAMNGNDHDRRCPRRHPPPSLRTRHKSPQPNRHSAAGPKGRAKETGTFDAVADFRPLICDRRIILDCNGLGSISEALRAHDGVATGAGLSRPGFPRIFGE